MKLSTLKFCLEDAIKDLIRKPAVTIASSAAVSISIFIAVIFAIMNISILSSLPAMFSANEKYCIDVSKLLKAISILAFISLPLISVLIVSNSLNLSISCRKEEIKTMKLVGAADKIIYMPILIEGVFIGIIGGIVSALTVYFLFILIYMVIADFLPHLELILSNLNLRILLSIFVIYGIIISLIGSVISLRRNLRSLS